MSCGTTTSASRGPTDLVPLDGVQGAPGVSTVPGRAVRRPVPAKRTVLVKRTVA